MWFNEGYLNFEGKFFEDDSVEKLRPEGDVILMQYTGLKDKNGEEIYEGDILLDPWNEGKKSMVTFEEGHFNFGISYPEADTIAAGDSKVIGNIYEHPHLLNNE